LQRIDKGYISDVLSRGFGESFANQRREFCLLTKAKDAVNSRRVRQILERNPASLIRRFPIKCPIVPDGMWKRSLVLFEHPCNAFNGINRCKSEIDFLHLGQLLDRQTTIIVHKLGRGFRETCHGRLTQLRRQLPKSFDQLVPATRT
jgi:hypothetical protein